MVYKGAGATGADAVHPLFGRAAQPGYFGILATQLYCCFGSRQQSTKGRTASNYLLHMRHSHTLGKAKASRTCKYQRKLPAIDDRKNFMNFL